MAPDTDAVGKTYPAVTYAVGREKVREFASAVGEEARCTTIPTPRARPATPTWSPRRCSPSSTRAAPLASALFDPDVGIDFARMVHGGQEFVWGPPVVAGDEIATEVEVKDIAERGGLAFFVFESRSTNQDGETVCTGTWTNIVR